MTYHHPDSWSVILVLLLVGGSIVLERVRQWRDPTPSEGTIEHAKYLYATGDIDLGELEKRLDVLADPEAGRIRQSVERVSGIGERTSLNIAAEFDTLDDLRDVDEEQLTELPNVGEQRAQNLKRQL